MKSKFIPSSMCPPDADQTERSPVRWQILALRVQQIQHFGPHLSVVAPDYNDPKTLLFKQGKSKQLDFWSRLVRPVSVPSKPALTGATRRVTRSTALPEEAILLEGLPAEILDHVMGTMDKPDIMAVALCSQKLWNLVMRYVETALFKAAAPWAGVEIAATHTHLMNLPDSFKEGDLALMSVIDKTFLWGDFMCMGRQINWAAFHAYTTVESDIGIESWLSAIRRHCCGTRGWNPKYGSFERRIKSFCRAMYPPKHQPRRFWILRNHTTRNIVRLRFMRKTEDQPVLDIEGLGWCRLDDVMLLKLCCENDNSRYVVSVDTGDWAGHRFDIVTADAGDPLAGWTDVTTDIARQAEFTRDAFRCDFLPPGRDLVNFCSSGVYSPGDDSHIDYAKVSATSAVHP